MRAGGTATVLETLRSATAALGRGRIENPRLTAELLMAFLLRCDRAGLYLKFDRILGPDELSGLEKLVKRRLGHEPVQYITGEADFMGFVLRVDRSVLIPRPETEILVEKVVEQCRSGRKHDMILDVGTGSGNIAVALAKFLDRATVVALDIEPPLLALENIRRHGVENRVFCVIADALAGLPFGSESFDIVVSNPPYIPASEVPGLDPEVRDFESRGALTDGADGLSFFHRLARSAGSYLRPGGLLAVETAYNQSDTVLGIFLDAGLNECSISPDLSGVGRVVTGSAGEPGSAGSVESA